MKFRTRLAATIIGAILTSAVSAKAQVPMWGSGYNMGQQPCVYAVKAGDGTDSSSDDVKELKAALKDEKAKLKDLTSRQKRIEKNLDNDQDTINGYFKDQFAAVIVNHLSNQLDCAEDYQIAPTPPTPDSPPLDNSTDNKDGSPHGKNDSGNGGSSSGSAPRPKYYPFTADEWANYCGPKKGAMNATVCAGNTRFVSVSSGSDRGNQNSCKLALSDFVRDQVDENKIEDQISDAKAKIDRYENRDIPDAEDQAKEDKKDNDDTEGGICIPCMARGNGGLPNSSNLIAAGIDATAAGLLYVGERNTQKMVAQYNSSIGYPTYNTANYAGTAMLGAAAVNSLFSGTGQGSYGCSQQGASASGVYGNGSSAFGYPTNMFGTPQGGGIYNPMTGTWGAAGPWGLQGNPYTTGVNGGAYPFSMAGGGGYPYGAAGGYPYGAGGGYPYGASGGGYPFGMGGAGGFGLSPGVAGLGGSYYGNGYGTAGPGGLGYGGGNFAAENSAAMGTTMSGLSQEAINLQSRTNQMLGVMGNGGAYSGYGAFNSGYGGNAYSSGYMSPYSSGYYGSPSISGYLGVNLGGSSYIGGSSYYPTTTTSTTNGLSLPASR